MNLYKIEAPWNNKYPGYVVFKDSQSRLSDFFIYNNGTDKFLNYTLPLGVAQLEIKQLDILNADFLAALPSILVFSKKAKAVLEKVASNEMEFYECAIQFSDNEHSFYISKIKNYLSLIDFERSSYETNMDGKKELDFWNTIYKCDSFFYIARDQTHKFICIVSQSFVDLCQKEQLNINFRKV